MHTAKDWNGNKTASLVGHAPSNRSNNDRIENDYYATEPKALELLLQLETFSNVWECACGGGAFI